MNWHLTLVVIVAAAVVSAQDPITDCNNKCKEQKAGSESTVNACQQGCVTFTNKESDRSFFGTGFFRNSNDIMIKCSNDCRLSYEDEMESNACSDGCELMRRSTGGNGVQDKFINLGNAGIHIKLGPMPDLFGRLNRMVSDQNARLQRMFGGAGDHVLPDPAEKKMAFATEPLIVDGGSSATGGFGDIFKAMHNQMKSMVQSVFSDASGQAVIDEQRDESGKLVHGGGELVVIKSGPGYRSERKYHLGPDADIEKILMNTDMNDMMNQENPIEQYLQKDQVEVFDPLQESTKEDIDDEIAAIRPATSIFDTDPWGLIKKQLGIDMKENEVEHEVNMDLDGPRLPETGLKSRHLKIGSGSVPEFHQVLRFDTVNVCSMDRSKQSWNEWFNCLHIKMGVPNWLLVATLAMGVIFTLWLCLVIPNSAPKQKIRTPKNVDTKELEANGVMVQQPDVTLEKVDLPPSYEDIVCTKVESKSFEAAKELETKITLDDDDEIVEPLPQKVNLDTAAAAEDRNCSNV